MTKDAEIKAIRESALLGSDWYCQQYPDVATLGMDPAEHYHWLGARLLRDPGPGFSTADYLAANPDVARAGTNPLLHYVKCGKAEGREVSPSRLTKAIWPRERRADGKRRLAVFAAWSQSGRITDNMLIYLCGLAEVADDIVFVADNDLSSEACAALRSITKHVIVGRHGEYDFGSYKRGIAFAKNAGLLSDADELILCNDSCYGPIGGFGDVFDRMDKRRCDFWGLTGNTQFKPHIQSYFVTFKRRVFIKEEFAQFFDAVKVQPSVDKVVLTYEVPMSEYFERLGFKWDTLINEDTEGYAALSLANPNFSVRPGYLLDCGCPLVKVKAFKKTNCNHDGIIKILERVRAQNETLYCAIMEHAKPEVFLASAKVAFSVIFPFHNRASKITAAVQSVLEQEHENYELVLVDDGSNDGSAEMIHNSYGAELASGRIVLINLPSRGGVSAARNAGLKAAKHPWIAYVDSDNQIRQDFLSTFASAIVEHPNHKVFYAWFIRKSDGERQGRHYNRKNLLAANFIDLGVFVHARELYQRNGGFDETLRRLVDWDLIIRYTEKNPPVCLPRDLMVYSDDATDASRISVRESLDDARIAIRLKYKMPFRVTTIIPAYNHSKFIVAAVESAVGQVGKFQHEVLLCDDGSTDGTGQVVDELSARYPGVVHNLSNGQNLGISATFQKLISKANGDFVAILEGDDVWTDPQKLEKQIEFLADNRDCSMVFSKILVRSLPSGKERFLERQNGLKSKLDGSDFIAEPSMNLIANFSSCLFKADLLRSAPGRLFEGRLNEIALAFYMERHGKIGFIDEPMSVYHQHSAGVWSGSSREEQRKSGLLTRQMALDVADPKYHAAIQRVIQENYLSAVA